MLKKIILYYFIAPSCVLGATQLSPKPFTSDYCTFFPNGTPSRPQLWRDCCFKHDQDYWLGGSSEEQLKSDIELKECVTQVAGDLYGFIIYWGVRIGHYSPIKHKTKWGWGLAPN